MLVRSPILPWIGGADRPFQPFSSTKPRIAPSSSLAHTTNDSAIGLFEIHAFVPFSDQPPETFFARESMPPGSEP